MSTIHTTEIIVVSDKFNNKRLDNIYLYTLCLIPKCRFRRVLAQELSIFMAKFWNALYIGYLPRKQTKYFCISSFVAQQVFVRARIQWGDYRKVMFNGFSWYFRLYLVTHVSRLQNDTRKIAFITDRSTERRANAICH